MMAAAAAASASSAASSSSSDTSSTGEEERMRRLFQTCDGDGDGYISRSAARAAGAWAAGSSPSPALLPSPSSPRGAAQLSGKFLGQRRLAPGTRRPPAPLRDLPAGRAPVCVGLGRVCASCVCIVLGRVCACVCTSSWGVYACMYASF